MTLDAEHNAGDGPSGIGDVRTSSAADRPVAAEARDWVQYLETKPFLALGAEARAFRQEMVPGEIVTYIVDRNINYTNVCITGCRFCAFHCSPRHAEAYVLSFGDIGRKIEEARGLGAQQILIQGGHNPQLSLDWYLDLLRFIKTRHAIHIHGFSAPEIDFISRISGLPLDEVLLQLRQAGLDSMPGGGAEILVDDVRQKIAPNKIDALRWLEIHETAHEIGLLTTATMMYGVGESWQDRIEHLLKLRALQARSLCRDAGRFSAFIAWSFQPLNTGLEHQDIRLGTGMDYLRVTALGRLVLDNFHNLQVSFVTQGPKLAQIALQFGANDFGSLMIEENVVSAAGVRHIMPEAELRGLITDAGFRPQRRRQDYTLIEEGGFAGKPATVVGY